MKNLLLTLPICSCVLFGCASITEGTSQTLTFNIEPEDARCVVTREGDGELGVVTRVENTLTVKKGKKDLVLSCTADKYKPLTVNIASSASGKAMTGAVLLDFGLTDMATGAYWKYPDTNDIKLEKE